MIVIEVWNLVVDITTGTHIRIRTIFANIPY
jgi:hypothetical protein